MTRHPRTSLGLTLVELLVVVTILAILAAIVMPKLTAASDSIRTTAAVSNLTALRNAIEVYKLQHGDSLPSAAIVTQLTTRTDATGQHGTQYGPYLTNGFPPNPVTGDTSVQVVPAMPMLATGKTGWIYDVRTGAIRLNNRGQGACGRDWYQM